MTEVKIETTVKTETGGNKAPDKKKWGCVETAVIVAFIGLCSSITVAIFNFPPLIGWVGSFLTPTVTTAVTETPTYFLTQTVPSTPDPQKNPPVTLEVTPPTHVPMASLVPPSLVMRVMARLEWSRDSGKAPFSVNFNAEGSTFQLAEGSITSCREVNTCQFFWNVYLNNKLLGDPFPTLDGHMTYTFTARGNYLIVVTVCRDSTCDSEQAEVEAK